MCCYMYVYGHYTSSFRGQSIITNILICSSSFFAPGNHPYSRFGSSSSASLSARARSHGCGREEACGGGPEGQAARQRDH
eukprot:6042914-Pyramimonas_sp.AAC.1